MYHTIGQRQGLGIGGIHGASEEPWYVVEKDLTRNVLIVAQGADHPRLFKTALRLSSIHWISGTTPALPAPLYAKTRYRQADQLCMLEQHAENQYLVRFEQPQRAITPGQSCVFYSHEDAGDICLGGGVIEMAVAV
jgi:tRNA-specific 2-thiouridylase